MTKQEKMIEDMRDLEPTPEQGNDFTADVSKRSKQLNICKPPKFQDWLSENFKQRTEFYYDKNINNKTYSIKEIESQYVMKFRTNI